MSQHRGQASFRKIPLWIREDLEEGKINGTEFSLIAYLWLAASWASGIVRTNAAELASRLHPFSVWQVREALKALREKRYIWYGGELAGLRRYEVFLDRFERGQGPALRVFSPRGQLVGSALAFSKKMASVDAGSRLPPKPTLQGTVGPEPTVLPRVPRRVPEEKPPNGEGSTEGCPKGSPKGESLSIAGVSPTDGGNFRRAPARVPARVPADGPRMAEWQNEKDPPVGPPPGDSSSPPRGGAGDEPGFVSALACQVLADNLAFYLMKAIPGFKPRKARRADLEAGRTLLEEHDEESIKVAMRIAVADPFWRQHVHSLRSVRKHWNKIAALAAGGDNGHRKRARGDDRAAQGTKSGSGPFVEYDLADDPGGGIPGGAPGRAG